MFEIEIYVRGLRNMGKIVNLDPHLVEIIAVRYKLNANHDVVYVEEPTLSLREIRAVLLKLGLEQFLSARFRPSFSREQKPSRWRPKQWLLTTDS